MNDKIATRVHWSFWFIAIVALIWNAMGCMNFVMQLNADTVASMPETHRVIIEGRPAWATVAFAIAVFGGTVGCLLLLLRKSASYYWFIASLIGVIVTMIHTLGIDSSTIDFSFFEVGMMIVLPPVVAAFLIWYAKQSRGRGWLSQA